MPNKKTTEAAPAEEPAAPKTAAPTGNEMVAKAAKKAEKKLAKTAKKAKKQLAKTAKEMVAKAKKK
ncbi:MAG: hypothetical protein ACRDKW_18700 [Actinomycetota bacterium]